MITALDVNVAPNMPDQAAREHNEVWARPIGADDALPRASLSLTRSSFSISAATSILVHVAILGWLLIEPVPTAGHAGTVIEALGVEVVDSSALESVASQPALASTGGMPSLNNDTGIETPATQPEIAAASPAPQVQEWHVPSGALLKADREVLPDAETPADEIVTETINIEPAAEPQEVTVTEHSPDAILTRDEGTANAVLLEQHAAVAGGAASRAATASAASAAAAGASPGQIARFAMLVRASLGKARPTHLGARARVNVAFVLSHEGSLISAAIAKSSANLNLDEAALSAVRKTAFPRPPSGLTEQQRSFVVPFDFK